MTLMRARIQTFGIIGLLKMTRQILSRKMAKLCGSMRMMLNTRKNSLGFCHTSLLNYQKNFVIVYLLIWVGDTFTKINKDKNIIQDQVPFYTVYAR